MYIKRVKINNFRTFQDFEIEFNKHFQIIAGANNAGKSNLLRALNLFFNGVVESGREFSRERDLPYHIIKASGSAAFLDIEIDLYLEDDEINKIKGLDRYIIFKNILRTKKRFDSELRGWYHSNNLRGGFPGVKELEKGVNEIKSKSHVIANVYRRIKFIYVPSQFDVNETVNKLVSEEVLPTTIDGYGNSGLAKKIKTLTKSISRLDKQTQKILDEKNKILTIQFQETIKHFPEIQSRLSIDNFELKIKLIDECLSDVLSKRIALEVTDASHNNIDSKGSGIQKLVLITLLEYFTKNVVEKARYTNPFIIWAIDEPEVYMQPKLQKKVREIFERVSKVNQIIITTHSPNMIDIYNHENVKLFYLDTELKPYKRKLKKSFYKKKTKHKSDSEEGFFDDLREHFGVEINDGWILKNKNILFEGNDDEIYFHTTFKCMMGYQLDTANIICNSATNMPSFASLLSQQIADDKLQKGTLVCLLDDDDQGREAYRKIKKADKEYSKPIKTISLYLTEKELKNENYPKMIEDTVIPEVIFESLKDFLKNKNKEKNLKKYKFVDFVKLRLKMKKHSLMEVADAFFDEIVVEGGNFSFGQLDVKYGVALRYAKNIQLLSKETIGEYKEKYPELLFFLKQFQI